MNKYRALVFVNLLLLAGALSLTAHASGIDTGRNPDGTAITLPFSIGDTEMMYLDGNGLTINNGTLNVNENWNPSQVVSINSNQIWKSNTGTGDATLYLQYNNTQNGEVFIGDAMNTHSLIVAKGSVGINTQSPVTALEVNGTTQSDNILYAAGGIALMNSANNVARQVLWLASGSDCNHAIYNNSSMPCGYSSPTGSNDSEYINYWNGLVFQRGSGGATSYFDSQGQLTLSNHIATNGMSPYDFPSGWGGGVRTYDVYASGSLCMGTGGGASCTSVITNSAAQFGTNVYVTNGNGYFHNSDERLKTNIETSKGIDIIDRLRGVSFDWKKTGKHSNGVIAQEVEKVMPEAVTTGPDNFKSVDYNQLIGPMIEAIKQLQAENQAQAARIEALEAKVGK